MPYNTKESSIARQSIVRLCPYAIPSYEDGTALLDLSRETISIVYNVFLPSVFHFRKTGNSFSSLPILSEFLTIFFYYLVELIRRCTWKRSSSVRDRTFSLFFLLLFSVSLFSWVKPLLPVVLKHFRMKRDTKNGCPD